MGDVPRLQNLNADPRLNIPKQQYLEDFTIYELDFLALAFGTSATQSLQIQADSHFKWLEGSLYATIANAAFTVNTQPIPSCTVQITDSGSGRTLFSAPVPVMNVFGLGQLPNSLPIPRVFLQRSSLSVTVANFDAAVTYNVRLSFIGTKIFMLNQ